MKKIKVLFICVHNSARSQMAEAFLKHLAGDRFEVKSAGLEPGVLNPLVVEAMKEIGIDISHNKTKSVQEFSNESFDYVITVCDATSGARCPFFPGKTKRLHWEFEDPSGFTGTNEEKLQKIRAVRDAIRKKIKDWIEKLK
jgi:arsenate reductase